MQQLSARENISPDNFSVHGKYDAYHILIAKLADDTFVVARYRFDHGVNLFLNFTSLLSEQHAMVAGGVQLHVLVFLPDLSPIILSLYRVNVIPVLAVSGCPVSSRTVPRI